MEEQLLNGSGRAKNFSTTVNVQKGNMSAWDEFFSYIEKQNAAQAKMIQEAKLI